MQNQSWLLRKELGDGVCQVVLNRAPVNALNPGFLQDFAELLDELAQDVSVRALVLSSAFKVFSAGLDLKEAQAFSLSDQSAIVRSLNVSFTKLFAFPKPTIAAVNGASIAGGLFFVLASDYRIATPNAQFGLAEVRVGADFPVGPLEIARATLDTNDLRRMMLSGQPVRAEVAHAKGIVDELSEADKLLGRATRVANEYASLPPKTFAAIKLQIRQPVISYILGEIADAKTSTSPSWFNDETKAAMAAMIGEA